MRNALFPHMEWAKAHSRRPLPLELGFSGAAAPHGASFREYGSGEPVLLPPFFIEELQRWLLVREQREDAIYQKSVVYPFTVKGEPFVPAVRPELRPDEEAQLCLVAYNLDQEEIRLAGRVIEESGREVAGGDVFLEERTVTGIDGVDKLLVTFRPRDLEAGRYQLQLALMGPLGDELGAHVVPFSVIQ